MKFLCADHQIDVRQFLEQRVAARLRHAAKKTEDNFRPALRDLPEHSHFAERLLIRHVAHAASVQEHDVRFCFTRDRFVAALDQRMRDLLGVALVHLTAVGLDEKFRHGRAGKWHRAASRATRDRIHFPLDRLFASNRERK